MLHYKQCKLYKQCTCDTLFKLTIDVIKTRGAKKDAHNFY